MTNDVTKVYTTSVKAEQSGKNVLILRLLDKPRKTWSKAKLAHYELEYRWLRDSADLASVLGNDFTLWPKSEIDLTIPLFDQISLF